MRTVRARGFTLIELLTVIAILSILFAITVVGAPRVIERARIANAQGTMNDLRTQLATYASEHGTFPPRYGYRIRGDDDQPVNLLPYTARLNLHRSMDNYDPFAQSHDANQNGGIDLLEYLPVGRQSPGDPGQFNFPNNLYDPRNPTGEAGEDASRQMNEQRPFIYIPVNREQARLVEQYYYQHQDWRAESWDPDDGRLRRLSFPPPSYDSFVLISVGPEQTTSGVVPNPRGTEGTDDLSEIYHITALRAYFLATRDLQGNGSPDFDFINRSRGEGGNPAAYHEFDPDGTQQLNLLPDGSNRGGPLIMQY